MSPAASPLFPLKEVGLTFTVDFLKVAEEFQPGAVSRVRIVEFIESQSIQTDHFWIGEARKSCPVVVRTEQKAIPR
jgi:hypothetical protein